MKSLLITLTLALCGLLTACEEDTVAVGYTAYNHTAKHRMDITVNGQGGVLIASKYGGGADVCCVVLPRQWRPDLTVNIGWQDGSTVKTDAKGNPVIVNGVPVLIANAVHRKTVPIPEYGNTNIGNLRIHFLPNDEIKVYVYFAGLTHPDYPMKRSEWERIEAQEKAKEAAKAEADKAKEEQ